MKRCSVIDAPSDLGLRRTGVAKLPEALRAAGLLEALPDARHAGRLSVPPYLPVRDGPTGILNPTGIRTFSLAVAGRVSYILDLERFPVVLGGDCSVLIGPMLALRRRGRFGLFFIDGHADFYSPQAEPNGEVASMELAVLVGREPSILSDIDGLRPLLQEEDAVVFGFRDADEAVDYGSPDVRDTGLHLFDLARIRQLGAAEAARQGIAALARSGVEGVWVHLDADVLNDEIMPAVDYRMPDGLWSDELTEALSIVLASPLATGLTITIYNPALDDEVGSAARTLTGAVAAAFVSA